MRSRIRVLEAELEAIETPADELERYLRIAEALESVRDRLRAGSESLDVIERQKVLRALRTPAQGPPNRPYEPPRAAPLVERATIRFNQTNHAPTKKCTWVGLLQEPSGVAIAW